MDEPMSLLMIELSNLSHGILEPHSAFQIAFNMFDIDGNQRVDKHEFLVVRNA